MFKYLPYLLVALFFASALPGGAQSVQNVRASFDGERLQILYDLDHPDLSQKFKVALFSSHDNFAQPLTLLTGDFGDQVSPGRDHKVTWFAKNILPADFDADITIRIRASPLPPPEPVRLSLKPLEKAVYKRGTSLTVDWVGGAPTDQVTIELLKDGLVQQKVAEKIVNAHQYRWTIPKKLKTGDGYTLRVSNPNKKAELSVTQSFTVKPRVPLLVKLLPVAAGAAIYLLLPDESSAPPPGLEDLPGPIEPD